MRGETHILGGLCAAAAVTYFTGYCLPESISGFADISVETLKQSGELAVWLGTAMFGAILPDIDKRGSKISNRHPIISFFTRVFLEHRGFTHSLLFAGAVTTLLYFALLSVPFGSVIAYGVGIGILSHILLDILNPTGTAVFFPIRKKISLLKIRTGGLAESLFKVGLISAAAIMVYTL